MINLLKMYRLVYIVVVAFLTVDAKHLPSYIKACKKDDPKLNQCAKQHAIDAIQSVVKGDREYNIPSLSPLNVPLVILKPTADFTIKLTNVTVRGLDTVEIEDVKLDLLQKHSQVRLSFKSLVLEGTYQMDGRILILPIVGNGPAYISCENVHVEFSSPYKLIIKKGKEYMDPESLAPVATYTADKISFKFDNLFNGDKNLGDRTNEFLNEHSNEIKDDFSSTIAEAVKIITLEFAKKIIPDVPYEEIFI